MRLHACKTLFMKNYTDIDEEHNWFGKPNGGAPETVYGFI